MFWARVGEWPGCFASGETLDELVAALQEAIAMFVTAEQEPLVAVELRITALEVRVGSPKPPRPARTEGSAGPLSTPPRINSPHCEWGIGRFDRR